MNIAHTLFRRDTKEPTPQWLCCAIYLMNGCLCLYGAAEIKTAGRCKYTTIKNGICVFAILLFEYIKSKATVELLPK